MHPLKRRKKKQPTKTKKEAFKWLAKNPRIQALLKRIEEYEKLCEKYERLRAEYEKLGGEH